MKKWSDLPPELQNESVEFYYNILRCHRGELLLKRVSDIVLSIFLLILLLPLLLLIGITVKIDSDGPVLFKQERITRYGKRFFIYKFRTMVKNADELGTQVTTENDKRVTKAGRVLRKFRLDELPQLINILKGDMTFVGTRPEVLKYVQAYTDEMKATLLISAGVTSRASIEFKDEEKLLKKAANADKVYIEQVLPKKMVYNLKAIEEFSIWEDIKTMLLTVKAVFIRGEII